MLMRLESVERDYFVRRQDRYTLPQRGGVWEAAQTPLFVTVFLCASSCSFSTLCQNRGTSVLVAAVVALFGLTLSVWL